MNRFVNPYNFIPLARKKALFDQEEEKRLTGRITVRIRTRTPLFIPNTSCCRVFHAASEPEKHKSFDFFSYTQLTDKNAGNYFEPVIPGSEIRGMIRSVYETLTASCMSAVNDDAEIVKRTNSVYCPGLVHRVVHEDGSISFMLIKAELVKLPRNSSGTSALREGEKIYFTRKTGKNGGFFVNRWQKNKPEDEEKVFSGFVIRGEESFFINGEPTKKNYAVFQLPEQGKEEEICVIDEVHRQMMETVLQSYQNPKSNKKLGKGGHHGYVEYGKRWNAFFEEGQQEYFPVYYSQATKKLVYLSPASLTKEAYINRVRMLLKQHGDFQPCSGTGGLCPACALFGMTGDTSRASSLRFCDARVIAEGSSWEDLYWDNPVTLQELAQPKIAAAEFYLRKPEKGDFWTYDYYVKDRKVIEWTPEIAGRKYYWHDLGMEFVQSVERTERNKTVRPLKQNITFTEDIYFDGITRKQLRQLLAILDISRDNPEIGEKGNGYKLGAGKPLGLGSIEMRVEKVVVREVSLTEEGIFYQEVPYEELSSLEQWDELGFCREVMPAFRKLISFDGAGENKITYPVTNQQLLAVQNGNPHEKGYEWFTENHGRIRERERSGYRESLPPAASENVFNTALEKSEQSRRRRSGQRDGQRGRRRY